MAGSSLLVLLDDIAAVLDDVALMTKVAAKKTAGVLGDDLAVNAEKVSGVRADRELPVVWAVAKGSLRNKFILVPAALLMAVFIPWLITPVLMLGGLFLCYEGFEKVAHHFLHRADEKKAQAELLARLRDPGFDPVAFEKKKINGAIRTDFILSAEIIILTLGVVADSSLQVQIAVVSSIALTMTVGVYGLVAGIVKIDDVGLYLSKREGDGLLPDFSRWCGLRLVVFAPWLMKALTVVGTAAMFLVGGGILVHGLHGLEIFSQQLAARASAIDMVGPLLQAVIPTLFSALVGIFAGVLCVALVSGAARLRRASA